MSGDMAPDEVYCALDGPEPSQHAVSWAAELAKAEFLQSLNLRPGGKVKEAAKRRYKTIGNR
jgi:hypothetical protein